MKKTEKHGKTVQKSPVSAVSSGNGAKRQALKFQPGPDQNRTIQKRDLPSTEDYFWFDHLGIGGDLL